MTVVVHLRATGGAPILKQSKFKVFLGILGLGFDRFFKKGMNFIDW